MMHLPYISLAVVMALTGCFSATAETVPDGYRFDFSEEAPSTSEASEFPTREVTLCYATADSSDFTRITRTLESDTSEILIRNLLTELVVGNSYIDISGGFHTSAVPGFELSCGTLTVNLPIESAAGRTEQELLTAETALANSLLDLEEVDAVNILFDGRASCVYSLPVGVFTEPVDSTVLLYADLESRQSAAEDADTPSERSVLLYRRDNSGYILPTVQTLTASSAQWTDTILNSLADSTGWDMSTVSDSAITLTPYGERMLDVNFKNAPQAADLTGFCACVTLTLTSFLPDIAYVRLSFNGTPVELPELPGGTKIQTEDGCLTRSMFTALIGSTGRIYMKNADDRLTAVSIAMGMHDSCTPAGILRALFETASNDTLQSCVPTGIDGSDILSVTCGNTCATVDLSANFYTRCQSLNETGERLLAYAMINTLTGLPQIRSVRFTVEGEAIAYLTNSICLSSNLMPDPGIVDQ